MDTLLRPNYITTRDDFFSWQYIESAHIADTNDTGALMILHGDQIIGVSLAAKAFFRCERKTILGAWQQDWYTTGRFGCGLFLLQEQLNRNVFLGGAGYNLYSASIFNRMARICWFEIPRLFVVCNPKATFDLLLVRGSKALAFLKTQHVNQLNSYVHSTLIHDFDDEYDQCWKSLRDKFLLTVDKTSSYMNWRYTKHPYFQYQKMRCTTPQGNVYFIWREEEVKEHTRVARLCDIIGTSQSVIEAFPSFFSILIEKKDIAFADFMCSNAELNSALLYSGMKEVITLDGFDLPRLLSPVVNDVRKRLSFAYTLAHMKKEFFRSHLTYFTKGDTNQDRPNP